MNKDLNKWYVWFSAVAIIGIGAVFIIALTAQLHPYQLQIYANDEMVATSKNIILINKNQMFNDCLDTCKPIFNNECMVDSPYLYCINQCITYYETMGDLIE